VLSHPTPFTNLTLPAAPLLLQTLDREIRESIFFLPPSPFVFFSLTTDCSPNSPFALFPACSACDYDERFHPVFSLNFLGETRLTSLFPISPLPVSFSHYRSLCIRICRSTLLRVPPSFHPQHRCSTQKI